MRTFTITKFTNPLGTITYKRENNGLYSKEGEVNPSIESKKGLHDFFNTAYKIKEIIDSNDRVFTLGDIYRDSQAPGNPCRLRTIKTVRNQIVFVDTNNNSTNITNATKIVQNTQATRPQATIPPTPAAPANNTTVNLTTIETQILESQAIRLERTLKRRTETPKQFLEKFFKIWNETNDESPDFSDTQSNKNTIYVGNSTVQTEAGRRRSLGDIFMIMRYYYPNITLKEVANLLYRELFNNSEISSHFRTSYCNTINKRVWYYDFEDQQFIGNQTATDEYGKTWLEWISMVSA